MQTVSAPDRHSILDRFSRAATGYDCHADHHRIIADHLTERIRHYRPDTLLELGCGTGILSELLDGLFPHTAKVFTDGAQGMVQVCRAKVPPSYLARHTLWNFEDSECSRLYDMVVSSCALQWSEYPFRTAARISRLVTPGGVTAHAIPVKGMLRELESSLTAAGLEWEPLPYISGDRWNSAFTQSGFTVSSSSTRQIQVIYPSPLQAARAVNGIGASLAGSTGTVPGNLRSALDFYRTVYGDSRGRVPSTYSVHFITAVRDRS